MQMNKVIVIDSFGDNYFYLFLYDNSIAIAVDCGDGDCILKVIKSQNLRLDSILITHHHCDHTAAAEELKKRTGCKIISPDSKRIPQTDQEVCGGDELTFGNEKIKVIATPGHTTSSVCYYVEPSETNADGVVFTGDTLFTGGCGRIFECPAKTMWQSLTALAALPENTIVYPGHNYTQENNRFAKSIDPKSCWLESAATIAQEKNSNIFLRSNDPIIKDALKMVDALPEEIFKELRARKDSF